MGEKVLFFGDFGIDDIFALLYAFYSVEIDVIGIVADYGNVAKHDAVRNARYLDEICKEASIPIIGGAEMPLTGRKPKFYPKIHGLGGLGPINMPKTPVSNVENIYEIIPLIEKYGEQLTIVSVGRLTSLAAAFIFFPSLMKTIKQFYIMGGAFNFPGNVTPVAEANIYGDPFAANVVFTYASAKINIFPLNVTQKATIPPQIMDYLGIAFEENGKEAVNMLKLMYDFYSQAYKKMIPSMIGGAPFHDLLVMWAVEKPENVKFKEVPVKVITTSGAGYGQTIGDFRKRVDTVDYPIHRVASDFNYASYINSFVETFMTGINSKSHVTDTNL
ncbi:nucleoside hydrolase [Peribacillus cavernae]|uniref:Nucleoside hydrolase n=1 Tax=Peribacillus cavernae TaxID=1674310 RepID=A0A3S0U7Q5_9BACI|nr:nucleoside hydrolase [Peribacillus cavernae]MDQ0217967.1 purine nucleosidase [Peribacillus cavernae]RUQ32612.1 nucleoside hydrolase [Peribacillus cavernae]